MALGENNALDLTLKHVHLVALQQSNGGAETGGAVVDSIEFFQHFINVGLAIMARTGIACRVHTGFAAQGIDFQSRVVAEAVIAVMLLDVAGLHLGIALGHVVALCVLTGTVL